VSEQLQFSLEFWQTLRALGGTIFDLTAAPRVVEGGTDVLWTIDVIVPTPSYGALLGAIAHPHIFTIFHYKLKQLRGSHTNSYFTLETPVHLVGTQTTIAPSPPSAA